jgi:hypothetical protein
MSEFFLDAVDIQVTLKTMLVMGMCGGIQKCSELHGCGYS